MNASSPTCKQAYSLVEMVMALSVSGFVMAGLVGGFLHQRKTYWVQNELNEMQQNLRASVDMTAREVRMAGSGVMIPESEIPQWFDWVSGVTGIVQVVTNVSPGNSSAVTIVGAVESPQSKLIWGTSVGDTTLSVTIGTGSAFNNSTKKVILVGKTEMARIVSVSADVLTISTDPVINAVGLTSAYPMGADIELIKVITYTSAIHTNATPQLYYLDRDDHSGDFSSPLDRMVGVNIESFQAALLGRHVLLQFFGRTQDEDWSYTHPVEGDGYRRRAIQTKVLIRNMDP